MSPSKEFKIKNLEVWGVGDLPLRDDEEEGGTRPKIGSVLDGNTESKAMLEMVGKKQHSDGYREPPPDTE